MNKWVYSIYGLHLHQLIIDMERLGYNGVVIQIPDHITELEWTHQFFAPLKAHCESHGIEIIPMMCGIGKLSPYLQKAHPEWMEFMRQPIGYSWYDSGGEYVGGNTSPDFHIPASVIHSDGQVQVAGCMNEMALKEWYIEQIKFVIQHTGCKKIFLSFDEIRAGGTCERCKPYEVSTTLANFVLNIIARGYSDIIDFYAWGDMFDPTHNAKHPFYHLAGSTEGALDLILEAHPDFKVVSWNNSEYFWKNNIPFIQSTNVDKGEIIDSFPNEDLLGRMYTTWKGDYSKLVEFSKYWGGKE